VVALAADLKAKPRTVGIYAPNGVAWVIAQLACALAGKIAVPLPTFFSPAQLGHVVRDALVELILAAEQTAAPAVQSGVPTNVIDIHRLGAGVPGAALPDVIDGFGQIIYTSGSTGQPKGVRHRNGQIAWSAAAICSIFIPA
jgi:long-subunit acyl-CoA synthetase (AMP-forming)